MSAKTSIRDLSVISRPTIFGFVYPTRDPHDSTPGNDKSKLVCPPRTAEEVKTQRTVIEKCRQHKGFVFLGWNSLLSQSDR